MKEILKQLVKKNSFINKYIQILISGKRIRSFLPKKNIRGSGNNINTKNSDVLYNCAFDVVGNNNIVEIDESTIINNTTFFIRGDNNKIKIGENVRLIRAGEIWIEDNNCKAIIGKNSTFEGVHIAVTEPNSEINIGKDCMFAYDIDLRTGDSHSIIDTNTNKRINYAQNINIGNHVWIASHVSILKGVQIKDNCIIATRAVVTKSFEEENILIGGIPAKKMKSNINWDRQRFYK